MAWTRRTGATLGGLSVVVLAALGMSAAIAQDEVGGSDPDALVERLDELELSLPVDVAPTAVNLEPQRPWGTISGDATSVRAVLDTLEPDLRSLFVDADDAEGEVAEAVSLVAQGWLDVWGGSTWIAEAEAHDLAFPLEATDEFGAAAGADELRGAVESGLELMLQGRERHLEGYVALRELAPADPEAQSRLDARAQDAESFHDLVRPEVLVLLSNPSARVVVPTERFVTDAPGVRSRATSVTVVCVERDELQELGGVATDEVMAELEEVDPDLVDDCPGLTGLSPN